MVDFSQPFDRQHEKQQEVLVDASEAVESLESQSAGWPAYQIMLVKSLVPNLKDRLSRLVLQLNRLMGIQENLKKLQTEIQLVETFPGKIHRYPWVIGIKVLNKLLFALFRLKVRLPLILWLSLVISVIALAVIHRQEILILARYGIR